ncbi:MAG: ChaN family lipoprotein [Rhodocyclaceae bacterium]|nr:ChaN family lipoprotein [Rhodocyclaceae bacterium]
MQIPRPSAVGRPGSRARPLVAALLCVLALFGCTRHGLVLHDHPLVGHVIDVDAAREVAPGEALARMAGSDAVLLGEVHDNPVHHRLQLKALQAIAAQASPVLAMEQFDSEHQAAIDEAWRRPGVDAEMLADAGQFAREGWGWPLYRPLVQEAVQRRLPLVAINLSREGARAVAREGFESMPAGAGREVVEEPWNPKMQAVLEELIRVGHCGEVSPRVLKMIVTAQRSRDAVMAERIAPHLDRGAVVVLGAGHARRDLAVPVYLARLAPGRRILSVGMVEVREDADAPHDYLAVREGLFDLVWFTPRNVRADPCEGMSKARMSKSMSK